ncbi:MAG: hypothetical protein OIF47_14670 [Marinibacterium sp.]|nr:hypothetical protein [Marinibacterium sp.]
MKLVCHIGTPKTATTYLQKALYTNRPWLLKHGVVYPDLDSVDANHITLFYASAIELHPFAIGHGIKTSRDQAAYRQKIDDMLGRAVRKHQRRCHTMVVSSENLTGNMQGDEVGNLAQLLRRHFDDIEIVLYLRRQEEAILSMYAEHMRRGFSALRIESFIGNCLRTPSALPYLRYRPLIENWTAHFGRASLRVRLFDRDRMLGGDILQDVLGRACPGQVFDYGSAEPVGRENPALSAQALEYLRAMQPHIPFARNGRPNPQRAALADRISQLPTEPRAVLSGAHRAKIHDAYQAGNAWVHREWFADEDENWFDMGPAIDPAEKGNMHKINSKRFAEFTKTLFL